MKIPQIKLEQDVSVTDFDKSSNTLDPSSASDFMQFILAALLSNQSPLPADSIQIKAPVNIQSELASKSLNKETLLFNDVVDANRFAQQLQIIPPQNSATANQPEGVATQEHNQFTEQAKQTPIVNFKKNTASVFASVAQSPELLAADILPSDFRHADMPSLAPLHVEKKSILQQAMPLASNHKGVSSSQLNSVIPVSSSASDALQTLSKGVNEIENHNEQQQLESKLKDFPEIVSDVVLEQALPVLQPLMTKAKTEEVNETIASPVAVATKAITNKETDNTKVIEHSNISDAFSQLAQLINSKTAPLAMNQVNAPMMEHQLEQPAVLPENKLDLMQTEPVIEMAALNDKGSKNEYSANIKIFPPELGHITAKLKITDERVELLITAQSNHVKDIIESNLISLREKFQHADIALDHVQVSVPNATGQQELNLNQGGGQQHQQSQASRQHFQMPEKSLTPSPSTPKTEATNSLVDTYA